MGDGVVLSFMDKSTIYDREYVNLALNLAQNNGIKAQVKRMVAGGNDSGAIHLSRLGVRTVALSLPCRYLHSAFSMVSKEDIESTEKLTELFYGYLTQLS